MPIYYSPSTKGLYPDSDMYGDKLPSDAIEITAGLFKELIEGQASGKIITPNGTELPYLSEPVIDHAALVAIKLATCRAEADAEIAPLQDAVDLGQATDNEKSALVAWKVYRLALYRLDTSNPENIVWPTVPTGVV